MEKTGFETLSKSYLKQPKTASYIDSQKLVVGVKLQARMTYQSTGQRSYFWPFWSTAGWPCPALDLSVDRSVNRAQIQRAKLSGWSTAQSTRARSREWSLWIGRPPGLPALKPRPVHVSVHIGRPPSRPTSGSIDQSVDRQKASSEMLGIKTWSYELL